MREAIMGEPDSICYDPRCKITEHRHEAGSSVPEAARAAGFEVFDGTPIEAFGGMDPELRAAWDRALDRIEEAERG